MQLHAVLLHLRARDRLCAAAQQLSTLKRRVCTHVTAHEDTCAPSSARLRLRAALPPQSSGSSSRARTRDRRPAGRRKRSASSRARCAAISTVAASQAAAAVPLREAPLPRVAAGTSGTDCTHPRCQLTKPRSVRASGAHLQLVRSRQAARRDSLLQVGQAFGSASFPSTTTSRTHGLATHHEPALDQRHKCSLQGRLHHRRWLSSLGLGERNSQAVSSKRAGAFGVAHDAPRRAAAAAKAEDARARASLQTHRSTVKQRADTKAAQQHAPSSNASASTPSVSRACNRNLKRRGRSQHRARQTHAVHTPWVPQTLQYAVRKRLVDLLRRSPRALARRRSA